MCLSMQCIDLFAGSVAVFGAVTGQFFGGFVCKKLNLKVIGMIRLVIISTIITLATGPAWLARCSDMQMAGVTISYPRYYNVFMTFL